MDFVGNSYNGYLVTDQKMDGDTLLIKVDGVDGWFNCHDLLSNKLGKVKRLISIWEKLLIPSMVR